MIINGKEYSVNPEYDLLAHKATTELGLQQTASSYLLGKKVFELLLNDLENTLDDLNNPYDIETIQNFIAERRIE